MKVDVADSEADIPLRTESEHGNAWLVKSDKPIHDKDSNLPSAQIYGCHDTKWSEVEANNGMISKDDSGRSYSGSVSEDRGAYKDETTIREKLQRSKVVVIFDLVGRKVVMKENEASELGITARLATLVCHFGLQPRTSSPKEK